MKKNKSKLKIVKHHLAEDIKTFDKEKKEDKKLLKTLGKKFHK